MHLCVCVHIKCVVFVSYTRFMEAFDVVKDRVDGIYKVVVGLVCSEHYENFICF